MKATLMREGPLFPKTLVDRIRRRYAATAQGGKRAEGFSSEDLLSAWGYFTEEEQKSLLTYFDDFREWGWDSLKVRVEKFATETKSAELILHAVKDGALGGVEKDTRVYLLECAHSRDGELSPEWRQWLREELTLTYSRNPEEIWEIIHDGNRYINVDYHSPVAVLFEEGRGAFTDCVASGRLVSKEYFTTEELQGVLAVMPEGYERRKKTEELVQRLAHVRRSAEELFEAQKLTPLDLVLNSDSLTVKELVTMEDFLDIHPFMQLTFTDNSRSPISVCNFVSEAINKGFISERFFEKTRLLKGKTQIVNFGEQDIDWGEQWKPGVKNTVLIMKHWCGSAGTQSNRPFAYNLCSAAVRSIVSQGKWGELEECLLGCEVTGSEALRTIEKIISVAEEVDECVCRAIADMLLRLAWQEGSRTCWVKLSRTAERKDLYRALSGFLTIPEEVVEALVSGDYPRFSELRGMPLNMAAAFRKELRSYSFGATQAETAIEDALHAGEIRDNEETLTFLESLPGSTTVEEALTLLGEIQAFLQ